MSILDRALSILGLERRAFGGTTTQTSFDYVDSTLGQLTDGTGAPSASATAAVQFALGLTSRAFMVAEVMPQASDTARLTPEMLAMTAREMLAKGNAVFEMMRGARAGGLTLLPVPAFEVSGGLLPSQWQYALKWMDQRRRRVDPQRRGGRRDSRPLRGDGAGALVRAVAVGGGGHGCEGAGEHRQSVGRRCRDAGGPYHPHAGRRDA